MRDADALMRDIEALSPPDRLRLAAELMEARKGHLALPLIERVALELGAAIALSKVPR